MSQHARSPQITDISWGRTKVDGKSETFKDVKLYPGGAREWDWRETGTDHVPGIQPADVEELLEHGARTVILSKGFNERLQVKPETLQLLEQKGVTVQVLQTEQAVQRYNALAEHEPVGALIHSTC
jgi:hypothetical protein